METLSLLRIGAEDTAFLQYVPENMRKLLQNKENICIGAVFHQKACGIILSEKTGVFEYHLRYIFVDPLVRRCGLGTYLVEGLLGEVKAVGADQVKAIYTSGMLADGSRNLSVLERAGFSPPKVIGTDFSACLEEFKDRKMTLPEGMEVYGVSELSEDLIDQYETLVLDGGLPKFADVRQMNNPSKEFCSFCAVNGRLSGMLLIDQREDGMHVYGLYVRKEYRRGHTVLALIGRTIGEAKKSLPPETMVNISAINLNSKGICNKLLRGKTYVREKTFLSVYEIKREDTYESFGCCEEE